MLFGAVWGGLGVALGPLWICSWRSRQQSGPRANAATRKGKSIAPDITSQPGLTKQLDRVPASTHSRHKPILWFVVGLLWANIERTSRLPLAPFLEPLADRKLDGMNSDALIVQFLCGGHCQCAAAPHNSVSGHSISLVVSRDDRSSSVFGHIRSVKCATLVLALRCSRSH